MVEEKGLHNESRIKTGKHNERRTWMSMDRTSIRMEEGMENTRDEEPGGRRTRSGEQHEAAMSGEQRQDPKTMDFKNWRIKLNHSKV